MLIKKKTIPVSEKEKWQFVHGLISQFIQRRDIYAEQLEDGGYFCHHTAFYSRLMYQHLQGKITLGVYLLDNESQARFTVLDADNEQDFKNLLKASADLKRGLPRHTVWGKQKCFPNKAQLLTDPVL
jgi:hypothetical protein